MNEVDIFLDWHKHQELILYQEHLIKLQQQIEHPPISKQSISLHFQDILNHWQRARLRISQQFSDLAMTLNESQIEYLFNALDDANQERIAKFNSHSDEDRRDDFFDKWHDSLEDILSSLSPNQIQLLKNYTQQHIFLTKQRDTYLRTYQAKLRYALNNYSNDSAGLAQELLNSPERFRSTEYQLALNANRETLMNFLYELSGSLSAKQIQHSQAYMQEYIDSITELTNSD